MTASESRWPRWLAVAALLGACAWLVRSLVPAADARAALPSFDIYSHFYPVMIRAAEAVLDGGRGLLWNPMQDCGHPFFATGTTGLLYPPFLFALLFDADHALQAVLFFNCAVGAVGAYLLCRELGIGLVAAVCAGLTFACSNAAVDLATSTPIVAGPYAWLPLALLFCERILRRPSLTYAIALAIVLTLALFPGHPQVLFFIYQVIALRVVFEMGARRSLLGTRTLGFLILALALPPLLGAVHLLPLVEVMRASVRSAQLTTHEVESGGPPLTWNLVRTQFAIRSELFNPIAIVPVMLAACALCTSKFRFQAFFHIVVVLVGIDLSFGSNGNLYPLYSQLPLAGLFRAPDRYLWIVAFSVSILVAIGADAALSATTRSPPRLQRTLCVVLPATVLGLLWWWSPNVGTVPGEVIFIPLALGAIVLSALRPPLRPALAVLVAVSLVLNLIAYRLTPLRVLLPDGESVVYSNAPVFQQFQALLSEQDRIHVAGTLGDFSLQQKTGSLFKVPSLYDYESLTTLRFAKYFTMLRLGGEVDDLVVFYLELGGLFPVSLKRPLLNLAAVRYVVVDESMAQPAANIRPELKLAYQRTAPKAQKVTWAVPRPDAGSMAGKQFVRIYEDPYALPRARWVPRVAVEPDASALLRRLANNTGNPRTVALVEEPPPSGFLGAAGPVAPDDAVTFTRNDPESLELQVDAPQRGFLVLADQWFPGWRATVNGKPAPILRANYLFRLVEVPAGRSTVTFRYMPASVWIGATVSVVTAIAIAFAWLRSRRRNRQELSLAGASG